MLLAFIHPYAAFLVLATGTATAASNVAAAATSSPRASVSPLPTPAVTYVVVEAAGANGKATASAPSEGNIYSVVDTAIWATMWIIIALIAKGAVAKLVEGARPKQY